MKYLLKESPREISHTEWNFHGIELRKHLKQTFNWKVSKENKVQASGLSSALIVVETQRCACAKLWQGKELRKFEMMGGKLRHWWREKK